jgi:hypothetical protein
LVIVQIRAGRPSRPFIGMETIFYILLYIKTPQGFESFGRFYIGNKNELAWQLFDKLKGSEEEIDDRILQMDLMETRNNLPVNIKVIGCTLEEMAENCKVIAKEAFKIFIL